jgi:N-acyl-D-aspartate/D-glutamate deacylase
MNPDSVVDEVLRHPLVMVASDGVDGHPRNAGAFARVLARQVRSSRNLSVLEAVKKLSLMPAQRLEASTPEARLKGRLQAGADADIVVFDLDTIRDRATFRDANATSIGVRYLIVGGALVVDEGKVIAGAVPGRPLLAAGRVPPKS